MTSPFLIVLFFLMILRPPRSTLFLHDALPISGRVILVCIFSGDPVGRVRGQRIANHVIVNAAGPKCSCVDGSQSVSCEDRKSTRLNSSHPSISYAVFCLKKKTSNSLLTYLCTY